MRLTAGAARGVRPEEHDAAPVAIRTKVVRTITLTTALPAPGASRRDARRTLERLRRVSSQMERPPR